MLRPLRFVRRDQACPRIPDCANDLTLDDERNATHLYWVEGIAQSLQPRRPQTNPDSDTADTHLPPNNAPRFAERGRRALDSGQVGQGPQTTVYLPSEPSTVTSNVASLGRLDCARRPLIRKQKGRCIQKSSRTLQQSLVPCL